MLSIVLGLAAAAVYGTADFVGGLASRRMNPIVVTTVGAFVGLFLLSGASLIFGAKYTPESMGWGFAAGIVGAIAITLLYAALSIGPISILSPTTALVSAIFPITIGVASGETLSTLNMVALALVLVAIVLVGFAPDPNAVRPNLKGLLLSVTSGLFIGGFLILLNQAPDDAGLAPLVFNRLAHVLFMGIAVLFVISRARRRSERILDSRGLWLAVGSGIFDNGANTLMLLALQSGQLSIVSALVALYPASTILLSSFSGHEKITLTQWLGLGLAVAACSMLAL